MLGCKRWKHTRRRLIGSCLQTTRGGPWEITSLTFMACMRLKLLLPSVRGYKVNGIHIMTVQTQLVSNIVKCMLGLIQALQHLVV